MKAKAKPAAGSDSAFPPWLVPGVESAAPSPAVLVAGADGDGAGAFAERLALKFAAGDGPVPDPRNCPDILLARPDLPKTKPDDEKTHYGVDAIRGARASEESGSGDDSENATGGGGGGGTKSPRRVGVVEFAAMRPKATPFRVVVIRRADRMNSQAANALLKTLEEPGKATRFILTAPAARALLPTVASRCRVLPAPRPTPEQAAAWVRAAGRDAGDLAFFANRPLDAAGEDAKVRESRRAAVGLFRGGATLDLTAAIKMLSPLPAQSWLEWLQKWVADAARAGAGLPPRFFPSESESLSRVAKAKGASRSLLDLHSDLSRRRAVSQALNAALLAADAMDDYRRAAAGRFAADFSRLY